MWIAMSLAAMVLMAAMLLLLSGLNRLGLDQSITLLCLFPLILLFNVVYILVAGTPLRLPTAAIGLAQLETLPATIAQLKRHARYYDEAVAGCSWLELQRGPDHAEHTFYHWAATFRGEKQGITLEDFTAAILEAGLSSISVGYTKIPAYCHPVIRDQLAHAFHCPENRATRKSYEHGLCPVAEEIIPRLVLGYLIEPEETAKREAEKLSGAIRRLQRG